MYFPLSHLYILLDCREDEVNYKEYRKRFSQLCRQAELQYYKTMFDSRTNNMKQWWKNLNTVCSFNNNKRKSEFVSKIMDEGREITDPYDISKSMLLNLYFSTVGERLLQQSTSNNKPKISPFVFMINQLWIACFVGLLTWKK